MKNKKSPSLGKTSGGDFRAYFLAHEPYPYFFCPPLSEEKAKIYKEAFDLLSTYVRSNNITIEFMKHDPIVIDGLKKYLK